MKHFIKGVMNWRNILVERGYKEHFVKQQIQNAKFKTREEALTPRQQNTNSRVPMVVTYHPSLPNIGAMLKELQPLLHCSEKCRKAVKEMPMVAFSQALTAHNKSS